MINFEILLFHLLNSPPFFRTEGIHTTTFVLVVFFIDVCEQCVMFFGTLSSFCLFLLVFREPVYDVELLFGEGTFALCPPSRCLSFELVLLLSTMMLRSLHKIREIR